MRTSKSRLFGRITLGLCIQNVPQYRFNSMVTVAGGTFGGVTQKEERKKRHSPQKSSKPGKLSVRNSPEFVMALAAKGKPALSPATRQSQDLFLKTMVCMVGHVVKVKVLDGTVWEGVFTNISEEDDQTGLILQMACIVDAMRRPYEEKKKISGSEFVTMYVSNIELGGRLAGSAAGSTGFRTDTEITNRGGKGNEGRKLQKWIADADDTHLLGSLEELGGDSDTNWDQFTTNERLTQKKSTFNFDDYSTQLDKSSDFYKNNISWARATAARITSTETSNVQQAIERGHAVEISEEDLFSTVLDDSALPPTLKTAEKAKDETNSKPTAQPEENGPTKQAEASEATAAEEETKTEKEEVSDADGAEKKEKKEKKKKEKKKSKFSKHAKEFVMSSKAPEFVPTQGMVQSPAAPPQPNVMTPQQAQQIQFQQAAALQQMYLQQQQQQQQFRFAAAAAQGGRVQMMQPMVFGRVYQPGVRMMAPSVIPAGQTFPQTSFEALYTPAQMQQLQMQMQLQQQQQVMPQFATAMARPPNGISSTDISLQYPCSSLTRLLLMTDVRPHRLRLQRVYRSTKHEVNYGRQARTFLLVETNSSPRGALKRAISATCPSVSCLVTLTQMSIPQIW
eukprot:g82441.t1